jgi:hypothetical protein
LAPSATKEAERPPPVIVEKIKTTSAASEFGRLAITNTPTRDEISVDKIPVLNPNRTVATNAKADIGSATKMSRSDELSVSRGRLTRIDKFVAIRRTMKSNSRRIPERFGEASLARWAAESTPRRTDRHIAVSIQFISDRLFVPSAKDPDGSTSIPMSTIVVQIPKSEIVNLL